MFLVQLCFIPMVFHAQKERAHTCFRVDWEETSRLRWGFLSLGVKRWLCQWRRKQQSPPKKLNSARELSKVVVDWLILKKQPHKEKTVKRPGGQRSTSLVDDWWNHFHGGEKILHDCTAREECYSGCRHSHFLIKRRLQRFHHKPLVSIKNRKVRLYFTKNPIRNRWSSGTKFYGLNKNHLPSKWWEEEKTRKCGAMYGCQWNWQK